MSFIKSDIGAQSAWKGYSSQTLYIASRIMEETANDEYYPEHLEDLLIKRDGQVVEAVQVKNLSDPLAISDYFVIAPHIDIPYTDDNDLQMLMM